MRTAKQPAVKNGNPPNGDKEMKHHRHGNEDTKIRVAILETNIIHINESLDRMEKSITKGFEEVKECLKAMDNRIDKVESRLYQILFLISSSVIGLVVAKIFDWI